MDGDSMVILDAEIQKQCKLSIFCSRIDHVKCTPPRKSPCRTSCWTIMLHALSLILITGPKMIMLCWKNNVKLWSDPSSTWNVLSYYIYRGWDNQSPMPIGKLVLICKAVGICLIFVESSLICCLVFTVSSFTSRSPLPCKSKKAWQ